MPVALEDFVQQLEDSGILAGDTIKDFIPPKGSSKDADELVRELVRQKKLTTFQAEEVAKGNGKTLVLGNYVLMEKIGAGGMGEVYKAEHRRMDRIVAVKVLPASTMKDPATVARFEREVKAAAKISHPNIVAAHDADCANGVHFLVMELIEGSDLSALVKKNGPFTVEKAVNYCIQAAKGLEAAHKKGIVHRDIKPANLLLDHEGVVKILDMGLARIESPLNDAATQATQAELTGSGAVMGTVDYMSPEQAFNTKHADARADIYSLGCTLYYLLAGKATYSGETVIEKILAHREKPIPSLKDVQAGIPPQLETVFQKMVAKKAEGRYPNMTQLLVDLEKCCRGNETTLVFPERVGPASEFGQANLLDSGSIRDAQPVVRIKPASSKSGKKPFLLIGTVVIGVLILLAGLVVKVKTKDGTLVVTVNEPDAQVEVLNEEGKVEISQKGGKGTISISVDPGKHRLKVTKDGFTVFGQDIEIEAGDKQPITAKLVPLEEKLVVVGTGWHGWPTDAPKPAIAPFDAAQAKKHQEAWATYLKVPVEYTNSLGMKFRLIPPGEFLMGTPQEEIEEMITLAPKTKEFIECIQREIPQHKVILTEPFFLGIHEVTQAQYENLIGHNPSGFAATGVHKDMFANIDTASHPVEMVNWHDAVDFCIKLSGREKVAPAYFRAGDNITLLKGAGYQLPTEARWEFACRAGTTTKFWCGDRTDSVLQIAWIFANSGQRTHSVGLLEANPFGLHDTTGNVWEWCENWVSPAEQFEIKTGPKIDPRWALGEGTFRSGRGCDYRYRWVGGGESGYFGFCRPAFRGCWGPSERHDANGFRVSLSVDAVRQRQLPEATSGKKPLFFETPGFDTWAKEVAAMTAEQQLEAVSKKLVELNPEFDGMLTNSDFSPNSTPHIVNQVVLGVGFVTDQITDISPVRALVGLIGIVANGSEPNKGKLVDLSPLQGMRLEGLGIRYNQICDLQPLEGMPLSGLHLGNNQISDLSILKSMPLRSLNIVGTKVSDLFPIRELPLTAISLDFKPEQHTEILRSIKTLETINDKPAAEFWKEVEEQQMRKKLDQ